MEDLRPDCRRFHCCRCQRAVYICSHCDRGHQYCSEACRQGARRDSVRAAGARYQRTRRGRANHARRQDEYRRRRAAGEKVTHHRCQAVPASGSVVSCAQETPAQASSRLPGTGARTALRCFVCLHACEPYVRSDFLRCRRPPKPRPTRWTVTMSDSEAGDDLRRAEGGDPPAV
jgi:hypothetical protein